MNKEHVQHGLNIVKWMTSTDVKTPWLRQFKILTPWIGEVMQAA